MIPGWIFHEFENMSIWSEAHAIWKQPDGKRIDVTPHDLSPSRLLFAPDPKVALKRGYTASLSLILSTDPEVIAIESFRSDCEKLREEKFTGLFGTSFTVSLTEVRELAAKHNIPLEHAKEMIADCMNMDS